MGASVIAVLDIGKTNKKILVYDENLKILDSATTRIPEIRDAEGLDHDDVAGLELWFLEQLKIFSQRYPIKAISISAHGATWTALDKHGKLAFPELSYANEPGKAFHDEFYAKFGQPEVLQQETCTAPLGNLLNIGKALYFMREKYPLEFKNFAHFCTYNIHFGHLLTGKIGIESTYLGCHGYLWNFEKNDWSSVVDALNIRHVLPKKVSHSWDVLGHVSPEVAKKTGLSTDCIVTMGIHDSNAALLPYTIAMGEKFLLNTTGTWCVVMHEEKHATFAKDELGKTVFFNLNAFGHPVKTTIFLGGLEYQKVLEAICKVNGLKNFDIDFNAELCSEIFIAQKLFVLPTVQKGSGQFPNSIARVIENGVTYLFDDIAQGKTLPPSFKNPERALIALIASLVIQTKICFDRSGMCEKLPVFTEGGFRKNTTYNALLSSLYPHSEFYLSGMDEASAFGAAILGKAALAKVTPMELKSMISIDKVAVPKANISGFDDYMKTWLGNMAE